MTPAEMPPIKLRPWNQVYRELDDECPWQQASETLQSAWPPGLTAITIVDGQPSAGIREAIELAVEKNPIRTVLVWCDVKQWDRRSVTFVDICQFLCQEIAQELGTTDMIPTPATLQAQPLPVTCDTIHRMCRSMPERCVVLALQHVEVFGKVLPTPTVGAVFDVLSQLEENIANFSLVLQTTDVPGTLGHIKGSRPNGIRTVEVHVKLLSERGVKDWLNKQFAESGVGFSSDGYAAAFDLTGGHPRLLRVLACCLRDAYNSKHHPIINSPLISQAAIQAAAEHSDFREAVQLYSRALARRLQHDIDSDVRVLLYATAECDPTRHTPITPANVQTFCTRYRVLTWDYIFAKYQEWVKLEILREVKTSLGPGYRLRCFAFAEWLKLQGHAIPVAQPSAATPPPPPNTPTP